MFFKLFMKGCTRKFKLKQTVVCCIIFVVCFLCFKRLTFQCENEELNLIKHSLISTKKANLDIAVVNQIPSTIQIKLSPKGVCESFKNRDITILIAVKSYVGNYNQRVAIRKTWGNIVDPRIKLVFFVGRTDYDSKLLETEYNINSDIVRGSFNDSYQNNILKTLMIFKWINKHCPQTKYVLLVDDDYFVNLRNILQFVEVNLKYMPNPWWMFGNMCWLCAPKRLPSSKWYVSYSEYKYFFFPTYLFGGSMLTTSEVITKMTLVAPYVKHFQIDDVYVGMLANVLGLDLFHQDRFHFHPAEIRELGHVLTSHGFSDKGKLLDAWKAYSCCTIQNTFA